MRLKVLGILMLAILIGLSIARAEDGFVVSGHVSATDSEVDEGYFGIGEETAIIARPGTGAHAWLKQHTGQRVRLTLSVESESN